MDKNLETFLPTGADSFPLTRPTTLQATQSHTKSATQFANNLYCNSNDPSTLPPNQHQSLHTH